MCPVFGKTTMSLATTTSFSQTGFTTSKNSANLIKTRAKNKRLNYPSLMGLQKNPGP
ncbi:hypothetical protein AOP6_2903 [Desulfuromonas sp. AOP6]|nr:hypothetical protein AOP6_2903 [Desulfuromonas sp. AOP6]